MADVVPLRARAPQPDAVEPVVFDEAAGPGWLAVQWQQPGGVDLAIGVDGTESAVFRLAPEDVLELVRVLVEGLHEPGAPVRLGPPATVLPMSPRRTDPLT
jgi:hypothetical protein